MEVTVQEDDGLVQVCAVLLQQGPLLGLILLQLTFNDGTGKSLKLYIRMHFVR